MSTTAPSESGRGVPIEIGRRPLRLLLILLVAYLALVIAVFTLGSKFAPGITDHDGLSLAVGIGFGILLLAVTCTPSIAFLLHTTPFAKPVTRSLRRSAIVGALAPAILGAWGVTTGSAPLVFLGAILLVLAAFVMVRALAPPREETEAEQFVLRPAVSFVPVGLLALVVISQPHAHPPENTYRTAMKSDLRNLVSAQESHFDSTQRFDTDVAVLQFSPSTYVSVPIIRVRDSGWSATNTHSKAPHLKCGIGFRMRNPISDTVPDGEPACTQSQDSR
jgi:hypothetical protein